METTLLEGSTYCANVINTTKISFIHVRTEEDKNINGIALLLPRLKLGTACSE